MAQEQEMKKEESKEDAKKKEAPKEDKSKPKGVVHQKDAWLDTLVEKVKPILDSIEKNAFDQYRNVGLIVMGSGYQKGAWHSYHKERFMKALKVDRSTFSLFVRLGEMTPEKFNETKNTYPSIKQWYRGGKPKSTSDERQKLIQGLINQFPGMAKEIREILRTQNPYITEKELAEFNGIIIKTHEDPITAFIKHFYLVADSSLRIPLSLVVGFKEYAELKNLPEGTTAEGIIISILQEELKKSGITREIIVKHAHLELKMEWSMSR